MCTPGTHTGTCARLGSLPTFTHTHALVLTSLRTRSHSHLLRCTDRHCRRSGVDRVASMALPRAADPHSHLPPDTRPRVGPSADGPAHTHTVTCILQAHGWHAWGIGVSRPLWQARRGWVTALQAQLHALSHPQPHLCAGTPRVVSHTQSPAPKQFLSPRNPA